MSKALAFAQVELISPQGLFCELSISDVLACTKQFVGAPRGVSLDSSQDLKKPNFAVGTNDTMFRLQVGSATNDLLDCSGGIFPILRVDHLENHRHVKRAFHRGDPPDSTKFGGPR